MDHYTTRAKRLRTMRIVMVILGASAALTGCYTPSQSSWNGSIHLWIREGMPYATAIAILGNHGLSCIGGNPTTCGRTRGSLLTCSQNVVVRFQDPEMLVDKIEIPKIACIGGFG